MSRNCTNCSPSGTLREASYGLQEYLRATELAKYNINAECVVREAEAKGAAKKAVTLADAEAKAEAQKMLVAAEADANAKAQRVLADADNYTKQQARFCASACFACAAKPELLR